MASAVESEEFDIGILVCGTGQGVSITANKHQGIRAALCWIQEIARLARTHNNANILCMPGRYVGRETALNIMDTFFSYEFEGGRHQDRIDKIPCYR